MLKVINKNLKYIKIKKNEEAPESVELLAESIIEVSEGFKKIQNSQLKEKTIILLLHHMIGVQHINKGQIELVLKALPRLRGWYLKK